MTAITKFLNVLVDWLYSPVCFPLAALKMESQTYYCYYSKWRQMDVDIM